MAWKEDLLCNRESPVVEKLSGANAVDRMFVSHKSTPFVLPRGMENRSWGLDCLVSRRKKFKGWEGQEQH